jgi:hypothetical protein
MEELKWLGSERQLAITFDAFVAFTQDRIRVLNDMRTLKVPPDFINERSSFTEFQRNCYRKREEG